ncbi:MAG: hypothetical protein IJO53_03665 [Clostridia bacterium]|nr:hypothetical protein [Clostridia bacterium]
MKKQIEFEKAYEPVSEVFHTRIENTLMALGKVETVKYRKITKIWILAAAFVLIIGTAFAAGSRLGLMDFLLNDESGVLPLVNAQSLIQSELLVYQYENVIWSVDQAVYDGEAVRALIKAAPANPETHAVFFPFADDIPLSIANRNIETEMGAKIRVNVGFPELAPAGDGQMVDIDRTIIQGVHLSEAGEYSMYVLCPITLRDIDAAPEELFLWLYVDSDAQKKASFTLNKCESQKAVYLNTDASLSDATLKNVTLTQTPFASYLEIDYAYTRSGPGMTLTPETIYYATKSGAFLHTDPSCSGMQNALTLTYEEALKMDKDYLCPTCAGGSMEAVTDTTTGGQIDFSLYDDIIENQINLFFGGHETEIENGFKKTYIYSASETLPDEITLYLIKKNVKTCDSLTLKRIY